MKATTRQHLLALNRHFYDQGASRFSATRRHPWPGWSELLPELRSGAPWRSCLDVGCGNGRFVSFLAAAGLLPAAYLGIDGSAALLDDARAAWPAGAPGAARFLTGDLDNLPPDLPGQPFDLVVAFGVFHHLPGRQARLDWLAGLSRRLAPGGLLVVSFWLLDRFPARFAKLVRHSPDFSADQLEPGDALLAFADQADLLRYCHFPDDAEIDAATRLPGCRELRRFRADGPSGSDNLYAVLRQESDPMVCSAAPQRSSE